MGGDLSRSPAGHHGGAAERGVRSAKAIDYAFVWKPKPEAFDGLDGLKAVLSLGAGVDALLKHPKLPQAPIVRFVDGDLTQRMSDYVVAQVTMHQRLFTRFKRDQIARHWTQHYPPAAGETNVGIMGLGVLGADAAQKLVGLGFTVLGWSRTPKAIVRCADLCRRGARRVPRRDRYPLLPAAADARTPRASSTTACSRSCAASSMADR